MSSQVLLPRVLRFGRGSLAALPKVLRTVGSRRPLIVTDPTMVRLGYAARARDALMAAGIESEVYAETVPEPTVATVLPAVDVARKGRYDGIVALGGGSAIDSAKAISVLAHRGGEMRDFKVPVVTDEPGIPVIAVPTTAGTGSEVTRFTVITNEAVDEKMLCVGMAFLPVAAIVDFKLTLSVPPRITADTGIDALTHAIEAYVSRRATPFTDTQALAAMRLIGPNLVPAYRDGSVAAAREALMLGATLAGIAFSNASVALVHGMSRPIGAHFHVPHGLSNAMLLPAVTRFSIPAAEQRYADCARAIGAAGPEDATTVACEKLVRELARLNDVMQVPTPESFGIPRDAYASLCETMAEQASASGSPANNPRIPDKAEMVAIYRSVWNRH